MPSPIDSASAPFDAVLLTGGRARRLGGGDKSAVVVGGRTLLERAEAAVADAAQVIVVGPEHGGGPVAAIAAGLSRVTAAEVVVLASDQPFVTAATVASLRAALGPTAVAGPRGPNAVIGVALLVDEAGRDQPLCAVWRTDALRAAIAAVGDPVGASMRLLVGGCAAAVERVSLDAAPPPWLDCDTPEDVARAQEWAQRSGA